MNKNNLKGFEFFRGLVAILIAIVVACNMSNPLRANPLLGMFF